jgi:methanethiol S-methyltransferase
MKRTLALIYGVVCYLFFLAVFLRAIWFVWTMDALPMKSPLGQAVLIDAVLLGLFAIQHSGMARQGFKRAWTKFVQQPVERSTYVLVASATLLAVVVFWQPMPQTIWRLASQPWVLLLQVLFWMGWLLLLASTFMINHFDLFGLQQVWRYARNLAYEPPKFVTPGPYRLVRHPLYLGFLVAFWSAPHMTLGHLFFSVMCTGYILLAIQFEERDMVTFYGESYRVYRSGVSMLVPWPGRKKREV